MKQSWPAITLPRIKKTRNYGINKSPSAINFEERKGLTQFRVQFKGYFLYLFFSMDSFSMLRQDIIGNKIKQTFSCITILEFNKLLA